MRAGMPLVMMTARRARGTSRSAPTSPVRRWPSRCGPGQAVDVAEHRFLVATGNVTYQWDNSNVWFTTKDGDDEEWHYPLGRMIDRFTAAGRDGLLLLHAPGNTFIRDLAAGRADPDPARRADLEGPHGADVPALRVPARAVLVQLGRAGRPSPPG